MNNINPIKGKIQDFFIKHYPIPVMAAKSIEISLASIALKNLHFEDEMGPVYSNIFVIYVGKSGLACKTPLINRVREVINDWNKEMEAPVKFTSEGFTEYATGRKRKKDEQGDPLPPHDAGIIIRDEFSRLFKEKNRKSMNDTLEFLSQLHDCYIEKYRTRTYGMEGGKFFYAVLFSVSTETFLTNMEDEFFMEGLGNKTIWICEDPPDPKKLDHKKFFLPRLINEEWAQLKREIIDYMNYLDGKPMPMAFMRDKAGEIWTDYQFKCANRAKNSKGKFDGSFIIKLPMQALRLAMIYAALKDNFKDTTLFIEEADMKEAIEDLGIIEKQRRNVMSWWSELRREKRYQKRAYSSKYDLEDFMMFARNHGDLCTMGEISDHYTLPSLDQISEVLALGIRKKLFMKYASDKDHSNLSVDEYNRFKPPRGAMPQVFKLTKKGLEYLGEKEK